MVSNRVSASSDTHACLGNVTHTGSCAVASAFVGSATMYSSPTCVQSGLISITQLVA